MLFIYATRSTKVDKLNDFILDASEMDVVRLDVTMNDALGVQIGNRRNQLLSDFGGFVFWELLISLEFLKNSSTVHHLINEVKLFLIFEHLNNPADIGVVKLFQHFNFI